VRKLIALIAVASVTLAAPTAVGAGSRSKYKGDFEETGTMSFTLKQSQNGKKVINFSWVQFPLRCQGGAGTLSSRLLFGQQVKRKHFSAEAVDDPDNPGARLSMEGKLIGQNDASGTLRIRGKRVPLNGGARRECESGTVGWRAEKVE